MARQKVTRLLLDADGVLLDFVGGFIQAITEAGGPLMQREDFPVWDTFATLRTRLESGEPPSAVEQIMARVNAAVRREGFCEGLAPLPGAVESIREIQQAKNIELFIVTSPFSGNKTWVHERDASLKRWFDIPHKHVLHAQSKHIVRGDLFVDDKDKHIIDWSAHHPDGQGFLWDTPHNQSDGKGLRRLTGWNELLEILRLR